jgi:hypothetical protein
MIVTSTGAGSKPSSRRSRWYGTRGGEHRTNLTAVLSVDVRLSRG